MREILFRGKRVKNNEWVYGSFLKQAGERISKDEVAPIECWIYGMRGETALVDPETVGQYTGLTDKNGTKIFEGDVVMKRTYHKKKPCEVVFGVGCFHCGWGGGSSTKDHPYLLNDKQIEVIGNIYDNPELLKNN